MPWYYNISWRNVNLLVKIISYFGLLQFLNGIFGLNFFQLEKYSTVFQIL